MVIKLKTLLVLLLLSSTSFSQKDTSKICFPYSTAKKIAIDLVKGDSAMAELKVANKLIWQLNGKITEQDSVIKIYTEKNTNYLSQINDYGKIVVKKDEIITGLESDVNELTNKNNNLKKGIKWLSGGFLASVITILTLSLVK
jgi:cell division protein FtsL